MPKRKIKMQPDFLQKLRFTFCGHTRCGINDEKWNALSYEEKQTFLKESQKLCDTSGEKGFLSALFCGSNSMALAGWYLLCKFVLPAPCPTPDPRLLEVAGGCCIAATTSFVACCAATKREKSLEVEEASLTPPPYRESLYQGS